MLNYLISISRHLLAYPRPWLIGASSSTYQLEGHCIVTQTCQAHEILARFALETLSPGRKSESELTPQPEQKSWPQPPTPHTRCLEFDCTPHQTALQRPPSLAITTCADPVTCPPQPQPLTSEQWASPPHATSAKSPPTRATSHGAPTPPQPRSATSS